jgi:hypothetical protein
MGVSEAAMQPMIGAGVIALQHNRSTHQGSMWVGQRIAGGLCNLGAWRRCPDGDETPSSGDVHENRLRQLDI